MGFTFVLRESELETFGRCRRAWDFGTRTRRNQVPLRPPLFDFARAIREALSVYYLPAMDDWSRTIVRPLAVQAFHRGMNADREAAARVSEPTGAEAEEWAAHVALGEALLTHYFAWAAHLDEYDALLSDDEFWTPLPDLRDLNTGLLAPDGRPVRFLGRIDQLVGDLEGEHWVMEHRLVHGPWPATELFAVDLAAAARIWALERSYPHVIIAGTVYNELRVDVAPAAGGTTGWVEERDRRDMTRARHVTPRSDFSTPVGKDPVPGDLAESIRAVPDASDATVVVAQEGDDHFRRTTIRRSRASVAAAGRWVAARALECTAADVAVYPNPAADHCGGCLYRPPCVAMMAGEDPGPALAEGYRPRTEAELDAGERLLWERSDKTKRAAYGGTTFRR